MQPPEQLPDDPSREIAGRSTSAVSTSTEQIQIALAKRLQELTDWATERIQGEIEGIRSASLAGLQQNSNELVAAARIALRQSVQSELPSLEKEMIERARIVAEPMLAHQVEQWTLLLSDRMQRGQQNVADLIQASAEEAASRCAVDLESRCNRQLEAAVTRVEQHLERLGTQTRQSFLRHVVTELDRTQQRALDQARRELQQQADQHLQRSRQHFAELLKRLGETLLRQAYVEGASLDDIAPATADGQVAEISARATKPQTESSHS